MDPHHCTRMLFIASQLCWIFIHYLLFKAALLYTRCNAVFASTASLSSQGYLLQCLNMAVIPTQLHASLTCLHSVLAVVVVGTGLHEPRLWLGPFGCWKDAYTIWRFWEYIETWIMSTKHWSICLVLTSRSWHQFTSRMVSFRNSFCVL